MHSSAPQPCDTFGQTADVPLSIGRVDVALVVRCAEASGAITTSAG